MVRSCLQGQQEIIVSACTEVAAFSRRDLPPEEFIQSIRARFRIMDSIESSIDVDVLVAQAVSAEDW